MECGVYYENFLTAKITPSCDCHHSHSQRYWQKGGEEELVSLLNQIPAINKWNIRHLETAWEGSLCNFATEVMSLLSSDPCQLRQEQHCSTPRASPALTVGFTAPNSYPEILIHLCLPANTSSVPCFLFQSLSHRILSSPRIHTSIQQLWVQLRPTF